MYGAVDGRLRVCFLAVEAVAFSAFARKRDVATDNTDTYVLPLLAFPFDVVSPPLPLLLPSPSPSILVPSDEVYRHV